MAGKFQVVQQAFELSVRIFLCTLPRCHANSASGMSVSDDCKQKFMELKRKKTYRYIIFKIDEKLQHITVEKTGVPGASYEDFTAQLPENDC
ncbi:unnamed protein product [Sphagnum jensenii]|uniref:ADF-H domain-containing protein n=1 Tax=Sphagnum jensenii TaxID=128206 RepID=A0ABP1BN09_9BRYO